MGEHRPSWAVGVVIGSACAVVGCGPGNPCTITVHPGEEATAQHAFASAAEHDVICFDSGSYSFASALTVATAHVEVLGLGATRPVLDFTGSSDENGVDVQASASDFTLQHVEVRNAHQNGVMANGVTGVTFRDVKVQWTDASGAPTSLTANGGYALYPVKCTQVLIENCEASGASDSALYVGQSQEIVVRYNRVHGNVGGIEIENSVDAEVYGNDTTDNTTGILVFDLPDIPAPFTNGHSTRVHDNHTHMDYRENFARRGGPVSFAPDRVGIMVVASNDTEVDHNLIENEGTTGVLVASYQTMEVLSGNMNTDTTYDEYVDGLYVHDNTFTADGQDISTSSPPVSGVSGGEGLTVFADQMWDGFAHTDQELCFEPDGDYLDFDIPGLAGGMPMPSRTAPTPCTHTPHAPITWVGLPAANPVLP